MVEVQNNILYYIPAVSQPFPFIYFFFQLPLHSQSGPSLFSQTLDTRVVPEWSIIMAKGNGPSWETFRELSEEED